MAIPVAPSDAADSHPQAVASSELSEEKKTMVATGLPAPAIAPVPPPKKSTENNHSLSQEHFDPTAEFDGEVETDNNLPTQKVLKEIEGMVVLDQHGKTVPFKDLYNGPNVARRVLIIFIRHFFCGNCQEYIRTLTASVTPTELLQLPTPTFIAIVGCGDPSLIEMWYEQTKCPFPCYSDPNYKLYNALGMAKTMNLGPRPEYQRRSLVTLMTGAIVQSFKKMKDGKVLKGGSLQQVGGEFLFEPINAATPINSPVIDDNDKGKQLGESGENGDVGRGGYLEEKRVTWCHRMRTTRDHAEIPEIREVLGLSGQGVPGKDNKRWSRALIERKGIGLGAMSSSSSASSSKAGQPSADTIKE
ncbi:hypothetical protein HYFRA_00013165 [Hymenoscyphus fraxineus]|uniref:Uncharacterized protein n=1 Tax=Hymenoscyphus fraxineus TaxID=746836 RepID=A0A9N9L8E1_9HELO|nr:hypothetical protein HYFRA_00013165 [Hymenoscyphus fraxineus]